MSHRPFKNRLYSEFARIGLALSSDKRLELIDLLAQGSRHVDALAAEMEMSVANISQHLQVLRQAKLVVAEREGTRVRYGLTDPSVLDLWLKMRDFAESHLGEVKQLRGDAGPADLGPELSRDELDALVRSNEVVVIDVRPAIEFGNGHVSGAISIPSEELHVRFAELPRDKRIVAYCRGSYCLFADEAVAFLKERGFDAMRLEGGWPEWVSEGRSIEA